MWVRCYDACLRKKTGIPKLKSAMPLPKPQRRTARHNRQVSCQGYAREDGLWDIDARMTDIKHETLDNPERGGYVPAGEAFHDISMRLTLDLSFQIQEVHASIDGSPFGMCRQITSAFKQLEGTRIGPGWLRQCKELLGGVKGCTHLNELLPVMATTAIQAMWPAMGDNVLERGAGLMLNSCHAWGESSEVVEKYLPMHFQSPMKVS